MRFHPRALCSALLGLLTALGSGACAGTPLPEPPDELPRPDFGGFSREDTAAPAGVGGPMVVAIPVAAGVVRDGTTLLVINLDAPAVAIERRRAEDAPDGGGFNITLPAAVGDRVRTLFVSDRGHSPPLDLETLPPRVSNTMTLSFRQLADTSLPCLRVTPPESLVLSGRRGQLTIANQCGVAVELSRAALRTGAEGMQLAAPPSAIGAGAQVELTLEDMLGPGPRERLDILLLDVTAMDGRTGRYAIDVFSDLE